MDEINAPAQNPDIEGDPAMGGDMLAARTAALDIVGKVLDRRQALDIILDRHEGFGALNRRDRAFTRMIISTTLRRLGQIDDIVLRASDRKEPLTPPGLQNLLRIGAAQLLFMHAPDYAVVDTAVRIADQETMSRQKGLVNAVLRRIAKEGREWLQKQDPPRLNTPEWLMRLWIQDYELRTAAEIAQANMSEAPLDITVKDESQARHWADRLEGVLLPSGTIRLADNAPVQKLPGYDDGMWWVQDAAAAIPVQLFPEIAGKTVVDLCAAPGGKTAQLAAKGAEVIAVDRSTQRLKRLHENMKRLRLDSHVTVDAADALQWQPRHSPEYILLDAPCTATGTIRRHPDVLHLKAEQDLARLIEIQKNILDHAVDILAPGGILIYCTCSLQKAEGEDQVESLLARNGAVRRMPIDPIEVGEIEGIITDSGDARILPFHLAAHGGMDGFYIARLQKA